MVVTMMKEHKESDTTTRRREKSKRMDSAKGDEPLLIHLNGCVVKIVWW